MLFRVNGLLRRLPVVRTAAVAAAAGRSSRTGSEGGGSRRQGSSLRQRYSHDGGQRRTNAKLDAGAVAAAAAAAALFGCSTQQQSTCEADQGPQQQLKEREHEAFVGELITLLGEDNISVDSDDLEERGKPASSYHTCKRTPDVIVRPNSTEQVSQVVRLCAKHGVPVVPYGGGTSLEGQLLCPDGGVSIDMTEMTKVLRFSKKDFDITVQPGLGYLDLNELLKEHGLWFPLDPGPGATIGGMMACRCSGSTAVKYGTMRENVISAIVVLPSGEVVETGTRAKKSAAGYDLTRLFVGSEGTLGVTTEVTLRVHRIPRHSLAMRCCFDKLEDCAEVVAELLARGLPLGRAEIMDDTMVDICNDNRQLGDVKPKLSTLLFEFAGDSHSEVKSVQEAVAGVVAEHGGRHIELGEDKEACSAMWRERKEALWSTQARYPSLSCMITDTCVPLSRLPELIGKSKRALDASPLAGPIVAHAGDGNFHAFLMFDKEDPEQVQEAKRLSKLMVHLAQSMGGTCTGEHGVGVGKVDYLVHELGQPSVSLMATIKRAIDPTNMMNPGKVLPHRRDPKTGKLVLCG